MPDCVNVIGGPTLVINTVGPDIKALKRRQRRPSALQNTTNVRICVSSLLPCEKMGPNGSVLAVDDLVQSWITDTLL